MYTKKSFAILAAKGIEFFHEPLMTDVQHPSAMYFNVLKLFPEKLVYFSLMQLHYTLLHVAVVDVVDDLLLTYKNSPPFSIAAIIFYATTHFVPLLLFKVNVEWRNDSFFSSMRKNANNFVFERSLF